ncbi:hypothetical protein CL614_04775 [archaeon]|nr:hypothetical protein [archaeon]|tara:strand:- start:2010 stop:2636 length:627 start_codon:yes stop_codon:yes gene_type:complete
MKIDLSFNRNLINILIGKLPEKILNLDLDFEFQLTLDSTTYGWVRFDDGLLNAIYIIVKIKNKPNYVILKFNHINDEFLFKNIYMQPGTNADIFTDGDDNEYVYEYRYDSNMNLVSTYKQYLRESKFPKTDELHVKKVNEMGNQVDIDYVAGAWPTSKEARDFTNLFKGLEEQKIIVNKSEFYGLCGYGMKKNSDVIYLEIGKYESTE